MGGGGRRSRFEGKRITRTSGTRNKEHMQRNSDEMEEKDMKTKRGRSRAGRERNEKGKRA